MKPHVKQVISLWKSSFSKPVSQVEPYKMSEQLKNLAALFAPGLFYYYILDFPNLKMEYVHDSVRDVLGIKPKDVTLEKLIEILLPEEREAMAKKESVTLDFIFNFLDPEEIPFYKIVYFFRVKDVDGKCHNMLHQTTVLTMTECKKPEHVMVVHTDISHLNFVNNNKISFISLRGDRSYYDVDIESGYFKPANEDKLDELLQEILTNREKEIIRLMAEGFNVEKISEKLFISVHTIRTHRKNILRKTSCKNTNELIAKCLVEGVI